MHVDAFLLYLCHRFDTLNNTYMTFQKQKNRCINSSLLRWSGLHNQCTSGFVHLNTSPAVVIIGAMSPCKSMKLQDSARQKEIKPWNNTQADSGWACVCVFLVNLAVREAQPTWSSPVLTTVSWAAVTDVKSHYPNAAISLTRSRVNEFVEMCDPFLIR